MNIRHEQVTDKAGVRWVNEAAFGRPDEAILVEALRGSGAVVCSLVAEEAGEILGHVLFSVGALFSHSEWMALSDTPPQGQTTGHEEERHSTSQATDRPHGRPVAALGPVAVSPARQRQGIGSQLITTGLEFCRVVGFDLCIVLGHADYYPRFGFRPAAPLGIRWEHGAEAHFMVLELRPGALDGVGGVARYRPEFDGV